MASRDAVANIHIGIPHRNDAGRDDIQLMWDSSYLDNSFYSSNNDVASPSCSSDLTGAECWGQINPFASLVPPKRSRRAARRRISTACNGTVRTSSAKRLRQTQFIAIGPKCTSRYFYPFSSSNRPWSDFTTGSSYGFVPNDERDSSQNQQEIVKLQYTKNFGSTAYARIYGYTYYSTWDLVGPQCAGFFYACPTAPDYELSSHTRGLSAQFEDQIDRGESHYVAG